MKCIDSRLGEMIWQYQLGKLSADERNRFEAHLLECDCCFQEAYAMHAVVERFRENPQPFLKELSRPAAPNLKGRLESMLDDVIAATTALPKMLRFAFGSAVAVAVIILAFILIQTPAQLSDLARIEPYSFQPLAPMGAGRSEAERHFLRGMEHYNKGEYYFAIESLRNAVASDSTDPEFQFFLGVTYLLLDSTESAIELLHTAASTSSRFEARSRWYLGNAYLLLGDGIKALAEFQAAVKLGGSYAKRAEEMAGKIEAFIK
ncbi:MAG: zf-HC2 domain-containing protein [Desulfobacterales bacterium]